MSSFFEEESTVEMSTVRCEKHFKEVAMVYEGFPSSTVVKNLPANAGDPRDKGLIPGSGRPPGVDSSRPHGLQPTRLLHPWDFPGNSTGVGCHCLLRRTAYIHENSLLCVCLSVYDFF